MADLISALGGLSLHLGTMHDVSGKETVERAIAVIEAQQRALEMIQWHLGEGYDGDPSTEAAFNLASAAYNDARKGGG